MARLLFFFVTPASQTQIENHAKDGITTKFKTTLQVVCVVKAKENFQNNEKIAKRKFKFSGVYIAQFKLIPLYICAVFFRLLEVWLFPIAIIKS